LRLRPYQILPPWHKNKSSHINSAASYACLGIRSRRSLQSWSAKVETSPIPNDHEDNVCSFFEDRFIDFALCYFRYQKRPRPCKAKYTPYIYSKQHLHAPRLRVKDSELDTLRKLNTSLCNTFNRDTITEFMRSSRSNARGCVERRKLSRHGILLA
jgi:hypothetical protein